MAGIGHLFSQKIKENRCEQCLQAPICMLSNARGDHQKLLLDQLRFPACFLNRGEYLYRQGQQADNLYIIRTGILKSYMTKANGEEWVMGFYLPPDLLGWEGMDKAQHVASMIALDQTNICVIPTQKISMLAQYMPALGNPWLQMISRRMQQHNLSFLQTTVQQRVITFLLELVKRYHQIGYANRECPLTMTHQDIANYLRITPATISRIFHQLQLKKLIRIARHMVYLDDIFQLKQIVEMGE